MINRSISNIFLILCSLAITCLALELALRFSGYVPEVVPPYLYQNHPLTWWTLRPNYNETVLSQDGYVTYAVNAQGIRSSKVFLRQAETAGRRIFLIGDSYTFGQGIDENFTFARVLENSLQSKHWNVEVVNLGVPGFGTMHSYYRLTEYAELLGTPNLVVYAFTQNDPVDNISGKKEVVNGIRIDAHRQHKQLLSYLGHLHFNSRLVGFVLTRLYPFFNPRLEKTEILKAQEIPVDEREDFRATATYLAKMRDWAKDHQVKFVVLINSSSEYSLPLRRLLAQDGTVALDAEQFFTKYNPAGESIDLKEGHWNAMGHACVAQGLEAYLLKEEWGKQQNSGAR